MHSHSWQRLKDIVDAALERDQQSWPAWLAETCGDDIDLFLEVSSLLAASRQHGDFIERPAIESLGLTPKRSLKSPRQEKK